MTLNDFMNDHNYEFNFPTHLRLYQRLFSMFWFAAEDIAAHAPHFSIFIIKQALLLIRSMDRSSKYFSFYDSCISFGFFFFWFIFASRHSAGLEGTCTLAWDGGTDGWMDG